MKTWRDSKGNVWHRGPAKNSVTTHREWVAPMGDGWLEWNSVPGQHLDKNDRKDAIAAIARLWPSPTKAQLWRRVARLAGELVMIDGASDPMWALKSGSSALEAIQDLIHRFRMAGPSKREVRILAKLEAALAAWEAAE